MENAGHGSNHSKRSHRRGSNGHLSMSDTDSTASQVDSWHSPLRTESPLRSDDPSFHQENDNKSLKSLVSVDKYYSPVPSPGTSNFPASSPASGRMGWRPWPHSEKPTSENPGFPASYPVSGGRGGRREKPMVENHEFQAKGGSPVVLGLNRLMREEPPPGMKKIRAVHGGGGHLDEGYVGGGGGEDGVGGEALSRTAALRWSERSAATRKMALVFRVLEVILCLVSFSIMAADKTKGWSGDSFDRYKEYRYCLVVNIIGFVYSGFQACGLAYSLGTEKHVLSHHIRYHFDFSMDQILAYLLISASSSAATRVDDWISNWGKDQFTLMASASICVSFLAFTAFALSSLISGYNLCNRDTT